MKILSVGTQEQDEFHIEFRLEKENEYEMLEQIVKAMIESKFEYKVAATKKMFPYMVRRTSVIICERNGEATMKVKAICKG